MCLPEAALAAHSAEALTEARVESTEQRSLSNAEGGSVLKTNPCRRSSRPRTHVAREATIHDAKALSSLFQQDYVQSHRELHSGSISGSADGAEWEAALGAVDFEDVLAASSQPQRQRKERKAGRNQSGAADKSVRLLKCIERSSTNGCPVGYVLYELREKGPRTCRQKYCELVNIVVQESSRGNGAGRVLLDALQEDLAQSAPDHAADLRLYVAEQNCVPLNWYRRIGFRDAGWQTESIGGDTVRFIRMALKVPPAK